MGMLEDLLPKFGNHQAILAKALSAFLATLPEQRTAISRALEARDRSALKTTTHRLKGSLGYFGSPEMVATCQTIEARSVDAPMEELAELVQGLDATVGNLSQELDALLAELNQP